MRIKSASLSAQCGGGPCDAMRYERGPAWNPNGTVDDSPQANGGIIRCGNKRRDPVKQST